MFRLSCSLSGSCHNDLGALQAARLNLTAPEAYRQLVEVAATSVPGWTRVVPGHPESSYLLVKLGAVDGPRGPRGTFMPPGPGAQLCPQIVGAVERWIAAGALPAAPDAGTD